MGGRQSTVAPSDVDPKKGKAYEKDESFNGPIGERKCRDVLCLLLFVLFWAVWILEAILVYTDGCPDNCNTPYRLIYGYDSSGNMCGGSSIPDNKRMFIGLPIKLTSTRVCVTSCPKTTGDLLCVDSNGLVTAAPTTVSGLATMKLCYSQTTAVDCCYATYPTKEVMFKCVPDVGIDSASYNASTMGPASSLNAAISFALDPAGAFGSAIAKMVQYWVVLVGAAIVALVLGFIWLLFLRLFVGVMVWATVVGILLCLIIISIFAWEKAGQIDLSSVTAETSKYVSTPGVEVDQQTARVIAIIVSIITIIYFLLFCVFMQRIRIAVQIIKEAAKAIAAMPFLVLYPVVTFAFCCALFVWWIIMLAYLASAGEFDPRTMTFTYPNTATCLSDMQARNSSVTSTDGTALCKMYRGDVDNAMTAWLPPQNARAPAVTSGNSTMSYIFSYTSQLPIQLTSSTYDFFLLYHLFGGLWTYAFTLGIGYLVIAGAVATWFWARDKKNLGRFPVLSSFRRAIRYHMGSVAFGSLILAIVQTIRIVFNYMMNRMKRAKDHPIVKVLICIVNCCLMCLERFINFLNKNAYIMIAVHGKGFCPSAKDAFMLLLRNVLRVAAVNIIGDFMLLLGKIFVCVGTIFSAWAYFQAIKSDPTLLPKALQPNTDAAIDSTPIFPMLLVAGIGFIVGCAFMNVFETAIDTVFLAFCEGCERGYDMPPSLMSIVGQKKKKAKDTEDGETAKSAD